MKNARNHKAIWENKTMMTMGPIEVSGRDVAISEEGQYGLAHALDLTHVELPSDDEDESSRKSRVRARTISIKRLSKRELERGRMLFPESEMQRPKSRGDCLHGEHSERPCPYVSCKHHLFLDVNDRTGSIKLNFPELEVWDLPETCALDIADRGGITLEEVGEIMNLTRERIRQLETRGLAKLKALGEMASLSDYCDD
jgi:Sigma-70, region 4